MDNPVIVVSAPDCPRCEACKLDLRGRGVEVQEISHTEAMERHDRDNYMAALADNGMAFPMIMDQPGGWTGWRN